MYITKLHLKNLKRLHNIELDFTHEGKPRMWSVFVAENGACKTTLLQAIGLAASGPDRANQLADVPSLPDLRSPAETVSIRSCFEFGSRQDKWRAFPEGFEFASGKGRPGIGGHLILEANQSVFSGESVIEAEIQEASESPTKESQNTPSDFSHSRLEIMNQIEMALLKSNTSPSEGRRYLEKVSSALDPQELKVISWMIDNAHYRIDPISQARSKSFPGWLVAGYGIQRSLPVPLGVSELKDRVLNRLEPLFGKAPLVGTGFANHFVDTRFFEPFIRALQQVLVANHLLPNVEGIELRGRGGMSQPGELVRSHSFEFSFSGQKTKVPATWLSQGYQSTIAWIADLIGQMYLDLGEPIALEDMEGIVLIDELDLHLHPSWQVRLVPVLKRVFPNMQFIVTTHSPMLLPALERHEIVMLRLDEHGNVVAEPPPASPKLMTGSEIYSSFFNIQKLYPSELGDELRRYTYLSSDPTRTDDEDAEMLRLQTKLTEAGLDLGLPPVPRDVS